MLSYVSLLTVTTTDNLRMAPTSETPSNQPQASANLASSIMASPTSHQAAHAVFNTNELLCDIIVRLPSEDIFHATGVCQTWRKALKENTPIRQAMFLAPVDISDIMSETDCLTRSVEDIPRDQYIIVGEIHSYVPDKWSAKTLFDDKCTKPLSKRPFGVWADMFVTQPPCKTFNVSLRVADPYDSQTLSFDFTCETGVKMGELHDFCRSKFLSYDKAVHTIVEPVRFIEASHSRDRIGGRWEVRNGKVCRQTQSRLIEMPDETSSDESGYSDEERYNCSVDFGDYDDYDSGDDYYGDGGDDDGGDSYGGEY
jgi:hypothetical protein